MTGTQKTESILERHNRLFDRPKESSLIDGMGWVAASVLIVGTIFGSLYLLAA